MLCHVHYVRKTYAHVVSVCLQSTDLQIHKFCISYLYVFRAVEVQVWGLGLSGVEDLGLRGRGQAQVKGWSKSGIATATSNIIPLHQLLLYYTVFKRS